jgi:hypothetical protein
MKARFLLQISAGILVVLAATPSFSAGVTVLFNDQAVEIDQVLSDPINLWVSPKHLPSINGFTLKPEGACLDEICIPIKQNEDSELFVTRQGQKWFNVTAFANKIQQPFVADRANSVYSFGAVPSSRKPFLESAVAPDFALKDRNGKTVKLSDFRGKKVMIVTWASW